jgi:hypothetical protein
MSADKVEFELFESAEVGEPAELQMPIYIFLAEESLETLVKQMNLHAKNGYRLVSELKTVASPHTIPATSMWTVVMELQEPIASNPQDIKIGLMLYTGEEGTPPMGGFEA